ncbi:MAG: glycosyltransferase family 2 protein [Candidatus Hodarchaeales archaeon]
MQNNQLSDGFKPNYNYTRNLETIVIIPTKNRPEKLHRALTSVTNQTRKPLTVYVISDCDYLYEKRTRQVVDEFKNSITLVYSKNSRNPGLSGALNTGIYIIRKQEENQRIFLAFLDDDDWWDRNYLDRCLVKALETNTDWVISGIIRHDDNFPDGVKLPIPSRISRADFLVTNPNVQGSNLFVLYDRILEIGGFDEDLVCTTDRDICIRLLDLKEMNYTILNEYLVHHMAFLTQGRLSTPGSITKKKGLKQFYRKYESDMSESQKFLFKKRALDYFNVDLSDFQ